jgi:hypothetical protein
MTTKERLSEGELTEIRARDAVHPDDRKRILAELDATRAELAAERAVAPDEFLRLAYERGYERGRAELAAAQAEVAELKDILEKERSR